MFKRIFVSVILTFIVLMGSQCSNQKRSDSPVDEYHSITRNFLARSEKVRFKQDYIILIKERNVLLKKLLGRLPKHPSEDRLELIRGKILFDLKKMQDAAVIFEYLINKQSSLTDQAKFEKVRIYLESQQHELALELFQQVEKAVPRDKHFYDVIYRFAFQLKDLDKRWIFSQRYLHASREKKYLRSGIGSLYTNLAEIERVRFDKKKAIQTLEQALKQSLPSQDNRTILCYLKPLHLVGLSAPAVRAEHWLNSDPTAPAINRGKITLLDFWSPACPPCREILPRLNKLRDRYQSQGMLVVGIVQITRRYSDDIHHKVKVNPDEYIKLTGDYLERNHITFPVALTRGNNVQESYGVLGYPTLFLLDQSGKIREFKLGSEGLETFIAKIEYFLLGKTPRN